MKNTGSMVKRLTVILVGVCVLTGLLSGCLALGGLVASGLMKENGSVSTSVGNGSGSSTASVGSGGISLWGRTCTITFDSGAEAEKNPEPLRVRAQTRASEPTQPTRSGYRFLGWSDKENGETKFSFSEPVAVDMTLYAIWAKECGEIGTVYELEPEHIQFDETEKVKYVDNIVVAYTVPGLTDEQKDSIAAKIGGVVAGSLDKVSHLLQIRVTAGSASELLEKSEILMQLEEVRYASYDLILPPPEPTYADTDPWGGKNKWEDVTDKKDPKGNNWAWEAIGAKDAWVFCDEHVTLEPVTVGVYDRGFDLSHSDIGGKFRFTQSSVQLNTTSSHATSVASVIGAENNYEGLCGVAYQSDLVCFDNSNCSDHCDMTTMCAAFDEMLGLGARVINLSCVTSHCYDEECYQGYQNGEDWIENWLYEEGMTYEEYMNRQISITRGVGVRLAVYVATILEGGDYDPLFVQGAGNGFNNWYREYCFAEFNGNFCACTERITSTVEELYGVPEGSIKDHIIVVTSIESPDKQKRDKNGHYCLVSGANVGDTVDICAPGRHVYAAESGNGYTDEFCGTSAATPFVSGAAALVWSVNPRLSASSVKHILKGTAQYYGCIDHDGVGYVYPLVNVGEAVREAYRQLTSDVTLRFIDSKTGAAPSAETITAHFDSFEGETNGIWSVGSIEELHPKEAEDEAKNLDKSDGSGISQFLQKLPEVFGYQYRYGAETWYLNYGTYTVTFHAPGYQDKTVTFTIGAPTEDVFIWMKPEEEAPTEEEALKQLLYTRFDADCTELRIDDYDGDGTLEAFAFVGTPGMQMVKEGPYYLKGETMELVDAGSLEFMEHVWGEQGVQQDYSQVIDFGDEKFFTFELGAGGPGSWTVILGVRDGKWYKHSFSGKTSHLWQVGDSNELRSEVSDTDARVDISDNYKQSVRNWPKPYYLYWDGDFKEYGAHDIGRELFLEAKGASEIVKQIEEKGGIITRILYRTNGMIHINYYTIKEEGNLQPASTVTLVLENNTVTFLREDPGWYRNALHPERALWPDGVPIR